MRALILFAFPMSISVQQLPYLHVPVGIGVIGFPVLHVGLTVDGFEVLWTLGITTAQTEFRTSIAILALVAICTHLNKVQSTIETAIQLGVVNCVCEFKAILLYEICAILCFSHPILAIVVCDSCWFPSTV